jgi:small multidrug resistance pump
MTYLFLVIAVVAEVAATTFLKLSDGFSKPVPSVATVIGYAVSLYFLSLTLRTLPTGLVYAVWSGVGVVLIATIAWVFQSQKLDAPALCGMAMIVSGVVVINLFSSASMH